MSGTPNTNIKSISNNNNNNNDTSSNNNNNNNEPPEDPTFKFKYYIEKCYVLPLDLKNDIIYCQRAMRDFLKVHRLVSDVFKEQADADPVQMRRILDELQMEVHEINAEQQFLMLRLDQDLDAFYKKLEDNNIRTVPELGNAYISSLIVPLISDVNYKVCPQSVLTRDSEDMLIRKHFLIFQDDDTSTEPLKLSDLDDNVPLVLVDTTETTTTTSMASNSMPVDISIVKTEDQIEMPPPPPPPPLSSNLPTLKQKMAAKKVQQQQQYQNPRMLPNKIKSAGVQALKPPPTPPPMPALVMRPSQTPAAVGRPRVPRLDAKQAAFKRISTALATPPQPSPIAIDAVTPVAPSLSLSPSPSPTPKLPPGTILTKVPDTTKVPSTPPPPQPPAKSPPPAIVVPPATDFKEVAQSRMNLHQALQRARKTKHQPRKDVDDDIEVLTEQKVTTPPNNNNNSSKPTTVGKNKAGKAALEAAAPLATATNKKTAQAAAATTKTYKTRNAQGTGRKTMTPPPPTPPPPPPPPMPPALANQQQHSSATAARAKLPMGSPSSSDEIHQDLELELEQQRLCASAAQWRDEPRESRVLPYEYGHENFLGLFGLYTHDMVKKLCQRHSKRKRRTVQNASGVDYHYGQQLSAIDAVRQKKLKEKPEFLLSPKVKRLQAKKAHKAAAAAANNNRKSKSKTPEKLAEATPAAVAAAAAALANCQPDVGKQKCKECKKRAENLLTCLSCHGHFHLECHEDVKPKTPQATLSSRCPPCLRVLQLSSTNSSSSSTGGGGGRGTRCVSN